MASTLVSTTHKLFEAGCSLKPLTSPYLPSQVALLVVQILQLQMQRINFLACLGGLLLRGPDALHGVPVQTPQQRETSVEFTLGVELLIRRLLGVVLRDEIRELEALSAGFFSGAEDREEGGVCDEVIGCHDGRGCVVYECAGRAGVVVSVSAWM